MIKRLFHKIDILTVQRFVFALFFVFVFLFISIDISKAAANDTAVNLYDNSEVIISGYVQLKANDALITLKNKNGLIINNVIYGSLSEVFSDNLNMFTFFDERTNEILIRDTNNTLCLKLGTNQAEFNGNKYVLSQAPLYLYFPENGKTDVYVPLKSISNCFGIYYEKNEDESVINLSRDYSITINDEPVNYHNTIYHVTAVGKNLVFDYPIGISYKNTPMFNIADVLEVAMDCEVTVHNNKINILYGDISINLTIGEKKCYVNKKCFVLETAPVVVKFEGMSEGVVFAPLKSICDFLGYSSFYSDGLKRFYVVNNKTTGKSNRIEKLNGYVDFDTYFDDGKDSRKIDVLEFDYDQDYLSFVAAKGNITDSIIYEKNVSGMLSLTKAEYINKYNAEVLSILSSDFPDKVDYSVNGTKVTITVYHAGNLIAESLKSINNNFVSNTSVLFSTNSRLVGTKIDFTCKEINEYPNVGLFFDKEQKTINFGLFPDYITGLKVYTVNTVDCICITTDCKTKPLIDATDNKITYTFKNTYVPESQVFTDLSNSKFLSKISIEYKENDTLVKVETKKAVSSEVFSSDNNGFYLSFYEKGRNIAYMDLFENINEDEVFEENEIVFVLPEPIKVSVTDIDKYDEQILSFVFGGNYLNAFNNCDVINHLSVVESYNVYLNQYTQTTHLEIKLRKIQGYKYKVQGNIFRVKLDDPQNIYDMVIVLDPGHGGKDWGAFNHGKYEKDIVKNIVCKYLKPLIDKNEHIKAYYTRTTDTFIELLDRAHYSEKVDADLFLSFHINSDPSKEGMGVGVYYNPDNDFYSEEFDVSSKTLAKRLTDNFADKLNLKNRGIKTYDFDVLNFNTVPCVLIELGFLSNESEYYRIISDEYQEAGAKAAYEIIEELLNYKLK